MLSKEPVKFNEQAGKSPFVCQTSAIMSKSPISRNSQYRKTAMEKNMKEEKRGLFAAAPLDGKINTIAACTIQHNPLFGGAHV